MWRDEVLRKIKPTKAEEQKVKKFSKKLLENGKKISKLPCVFVGSVGKGTWLRGDHDIDMFIIFPRSVSREDLEKKGLEFGKRIAKSVKGKVELKYAEHPYTRIYKKVDGRTKGTSVRSYAIDIVPCYEMKMGEHIHSAVDRSPLHLEFVKKHINSKSKGNLQDDSRLLKKFCKAIGVYGSDAKHLGVSGYVCELLIIHYGSFEKVIKALSGMNAGYIISKNNIDKKKFTNQPLIVIDPVDKERNAAAVLSIKNFVKLTNKSKEFLSKPSANYFFPKAIKPLSSKEIKCLQARGTNFISIVMKRPDVIDDIAYPQVRRLKERIMSLLKYNEFVVMKSFEYIDDKIIIVLEMEVWNLPNIKKMEGPPVFSHVHSKEFTGKYKNAYISGTRWHADVNRQFITASQLIKNFLSHTEKKMRENGVPKHLVKNARKAKLMEDKKFWTLTKNKKFSVALKEKYI